MKYNEENEQKKKKFNLFDWYFKSKEKENDRLDINVLEKPTIGSFFKVLAKKTGKLLSANLLFVFGNFPIFFIIFAFSGILTESASAPLYQTWGPLYGAMGFESNATTSFLSNIFGVHTSINVLNTPTIVFICLGALIIFTLGLTKVGTTYLYRNLMSGEPIFPLSDFFYVIKRNFKQGMLLGIIDSIFIGMFAYNIYFLFVNYNAAQYNGVMLFFTVAMAIIYSFARHYAYIMVFTFDMKLGKIIKNALYFTILGIKRNFVALLGIILVVLINVGLCAIFLPVGALLPFIITFAICDFIAVYAAYPMILKYMVSDEDRNRIIYRTPYYENEDE